MLNYNAMQNNNPMNQQKKQAKINRPTGGVSGTQASNSNTPAIKGVSSYKNPAAQSTGTYNTGTASSGYQQDMLDTAWQPTFMTSSGQAQSTDFIHGNVTGSSPQSSSTYDTGTASGAGIYNTGTASPGYQQDILSTTWQPTFVDSTGQAHGTDFIHGQATGPLANALGGTQMPTTGTQMPNTTTGMPTTAPTTGAPTTGQIPTTAPTTGAPTTGQIPTTAPTTGAPTTGPIDTDPLWWVDLPGEWSAIPEQEAPLTPQDDPDPGPQDGLPETPQDMPQPGAPATTTTAPTDQTGDGFFTQIGGSQILGGPQDGDRVDNVIGKDGKISRSARIKTSNPSALPQPHEGHKWALVGNGIYAQVPQNSQPGESGFHRFMVQDGGLYQWNPGVGGEVTSGPQTPQDDPDPGPQDELPETPQDLTDPTIGQTAMDEFRNIVQGGEDFAAQMPSTGVQQLPDATSQAMPETSEGLSAMDEFRESAARGFGDEGMQTPQEGASTGGGSFPGFPSLRPESAQVLNDWLEGLGGVRSGKIADLPPHIRQIMDGIHEAYSQSRAGHGIYGANNTWKLARDNVFSGGGEMPGETTEGPLETPQDTPDPGPQDGPPETPQDTPDPGPQDGPLETPQDMPQPGTPSDELPMPGEMPDTIPGELPGTPAEEMPSPQTTGDLMTALGGVQQEVAPETTEEMRLPSPEEAAQSMQMEAFPGQDANTQEYQDFMASQLPAYEQPQETVQQAETAQPIVSASQESRQMSMQASQARAEEPAGATSPEALSSIPIKDQQAAKKRYGQYVESLPEGSTKIGTYNRRDVYITEDGVIMLDKGDVREKFKTAGWTDEQINNFLEKNPEQAARRFEAYDPYSGLTKLIRGNTPDKGWTPIDAQQPAEQKDKQPAKFTPEEIDDLFAKERDASRISNQLKERGWTDEEIEKLLEERRLESRYRREDRAKEEKTALEFFQEGVEAGAVSDEKEAEKFAEEIPKKETEEEKQKRVSEIEVPEEEIQRYLAAYKKGDEQRNLNLEEAKKVSGNDKFLGWRSHSPVFEDSQGNRYTVYSNNRKVNVEKGSYSDKRIDDSLAGKKGSLILPDAKPRTYDDVKRQIQMNMEAQRLREEQLPSVKQSYMEEFAADRQGLQDAESRGYNLYGFDSRGRMVFQRRDGADGKLYTQTVHQKKASGPQYLGTVEMGNPKVQTDLFLTDNGRTLARMVKNKYDRRTNSYGWGLTSMVSSNVEDINRRVEQYKREGMVTDREPFSEAGRQLVESGAARKEYRWREIDGKYRDNYTRATEEELGFFKSSMADSGKAWVKERLATDINKESGYTSRFNALEGVTFDEDSKWRNVDLTNLLPEKVRNRQGLTDEDINYLYTDPRTGAQQKFTGKDINDLARMGLNREDLINGLRLLRDESGENLIFPPGKSVPVNSGKMGEFLADIQRAEPADKWKNVDWTRVIDPNKTYVYRDPTTGGKLTTPGATVIQLATMGLREDMVKNGMRLLENEDGSLVFPPGESLPNEVKTVVERPEASLDFDEYVKQYEEGQFGEVPEKLLKRPEFQQRPDGQDGDTVEGRNKINTDANGRLIGTDELLSVKQSEPEGMWADIENDMVQIGGESVNWRTLIDPDKRYLFVDPYVGATVDSLGKSVLKLATGLPKMKADILRVLQNLDGSRVFSAKGATALEEFKGQVESGAVSDSEVGQQPATEAVSQQNEQPATAMEEFKKQVLGGDVNAADTRPTVEGADPDTHSKAARANLFDTIGEKDGELYQDRSLSFPVFQTTKGADGVVNQEALNKDIGNFERFSAAVWDRFQKTLPQNVKDASNQVLTSNAALRNLVTTLDNYDANAEIALSKFTWGLMESGGSVSHLDASLQGVTRYVSHPAAKIHVYDAIERSVERGGYELPSSKESLKNFAFTTDNGTQMVPVWLGTQGDQITQQKYQRVVAIPLEKAEAEWDLIFGRGRPQDINSHIFTKQGYSALSAIPPSHLTEQDKQQLEQFMAGDLDENLYTHAEANPTEGTYKTTAHGPTDFHRWHGHWGYEHKTTGEVTWKGKKYSQHVSVNERGFGTLPAELIPQEQVREDRSAVEGTPQARLEAIQSGAEVVPEVSQQGEQAAAEEVPQSTWDNAAQAGEQTPERRSDAIAEMEQGLVQDGVFDEEAPAAETPAAEAPVEEQVAKQEIDPMQQARDDYAKGIVGRYQGNPIIVEDNKVFMERNGSRVELGPSALSKYVLAMTNMQNPNDAGISVQAIETLRRQFEPAGGFSEAARGIDMSLPEAHRSAGMLSEDQRIRERARKREEQAEQVANLTLDPLSKQIMDYDNWKYEREAAIAEIMQEDYGTPIPQYVANLTNKQRQISQAHQRDEITYAEAYQQQQEIQQKIQSLQEAQRINKDKLEQYKSIFLTGEPLEDEYFTQYRAKRDAPPEGSNLDRLQKIVSGINPDTGEPTRPVVEERPDPERPVIEERPDPERPVIEERPADQTALEEFKDQVEAGAVSDPEVGQQPVSDEQRAQNQKAIMDSGLFEALDISTPNAPTEYQHKVTRAILNEEDALKMLQAETQQQSPDANVTTPVVENAGDNQAGRVEIPEGAQDSNLDQAPKSFAKRYSMSDLSGGHPDLTNLGHFENAAGTKSAHRVMFHRDKDGNIYQSALHFARNPDNADQFTQQLTEQQYAEIKRRLGDRFQPPAPEQKPALEEFAEQVEAGAVSDTEAPAITSPGVDLTAEVKPQDPNPVADAELEQVLQDGNLPGQSQEVLNEVPPGYVSFPPPMRTTVVYPSGSPEAIAREQAEREYHERMLSFGAKPTRTGGYAIPQDSEFWNTDEGSSYKRDAIEHGYWDQDPIGEGNIDPPEDTAPGDDGFVPSWEQGPRQYFRAGQYTPEQQDLRNQYRDMLGNWITQMPQAPGGLINPMQLLLQGMMGGMGGQFNPINPNIGNYYNPFLGLNLIGSLLGGGGLYGGGPYMDHTMDSSDVFHPYSMLEHTGGGSDMRFLGADSIAEGEQAQDAVSIAPQQDDSPATSDDDEPLTELPDRSTDIRDIVGTDNMIEVNPGFTREEITRRDVSPADVQAMANQAAAQARQQGYEQALRSNMMGSRGRASDAGTFSQFEAGPLAQSLLQAQQAQIAIPFEQQMAYNQARRQREQAAHQLGLAQSGLIGQDYYRRAYDQLADQQMQSQLMQALLNPLLGGLFF